MIYKIVAGVGRRKTATESLHDFVRWAAYEVQLNENSWQRKEGKFIEHTVAVMHSDIEN